MQVRPALYYIGHCLTSSNTLGHGIHSPSLYELVRFVVYDNNSYYCFSQIERQRRLFLSNNKKIFVQDYGTGVSGERRISDIAATSLEQPRVAQLLFRIVNHIKAKRIVELGTCLGVTTAYLASVDSGAEVVSFEGSEELLKLAGQLWQRLGIKNISMRHGNIDFSLPAYISMLKEKGETIDFAYIDANHTYEATMRYFNELHGVMSERGVIAVDDIHKTEQMHRAWQEICSMDGVRATIDAYHVGLVFFNRQLPQTTYKIRI